MVLELVQGVAGDACAAGGAPSWCKTESLASHDKEVGCARGATVGAGDGVGRCWSEFLDGLHLLPANLLGHHITWL